MMAILREWRLGCFCARGWALPVGIDRTTEVAGQKLWVIAGSPGKIKTGNTVMIGGFGVPGTPDGASSMRWSRTARGNLTL